MPTPVELIPSDAITTIAEQIGRALIAKVSHLRDEADEVQERWEALGRAGGQRDDHAAALMMAIEPHLRDISQFADCCRQQIVGMNNNPFGRN